MDELGELPGLKNARENEWKSKSMQGQRTTLMGICRSPESFRRLADVADAMVQEKKPEMSRRTTDGRGVKMFRSESEQQEERQSEMEKNLAVKVELLSQVSFIAQLPIRQQEKLALVSTVKTYQEDDLVVEQGNTDRKLFILCEGEVLLTHKMDPEDVYEEEKPLRVEQAPAFFGEVPLLTGEAQTESVFCIRQSTFILLDGDDFDTMLGSNESVRGVLELRKVAREAEVLDQIPLLSAINPAQKVQLLHCMNAIAYDNGETICRQGQRGETFYIIVQGSVQVQKHSEDGQVETVATKHLYDFFGESALLNDAPRDADVVAVDHVVCLYMHRSVFLESFPQLLEILKETNQIDKTVQRIAKSKSDRTEQWDVKKTKDEEQEYEQEEFRHSFDLGKESCQLFAAYEDWRLADDFVQVQEKDLVTGKVKTVHFESAFSRACHANLLEDYKRIQTLQARRLADVKSRLGVSVTSHTFNEQNSPQKSRVQMQQNDEQEQELVGHRRKSSRTAVGGEPGQSENATQKRRHSLQGRPSVVSTDTEELETDWGKWPDILKELLGPRRTPNPIRRLKDEESRNKVVLKKVAGKIGKGSKRRHSLLNKIRTEIVQKLADKTALVATSRFAKYIKQVLQKRPADRSTVELHAVAMMFETNSLVDQISLGETRASMQMYRYATYFCLNKGQTMMEQGERVGGLYLILRGQVRLAMQVHRATRLGSRSLGAVGAGGLCGYLSVLDPTHSVLQESLYSAIATCRTEGIFISSQDLHRHCLNQSEIAKRIQNILSIKQLTCGQSPENRAAVLQLAFLLESHSFPKDHCMLLHGEFFDRANFHFIQSGRVGLFRKQARGDWIELGELGPGECISYLDANFDGLAIASKTEVHTKSLPCEKVRELDEHAMHSLQAFSQVKLFAREFSEMRSVTFERKRDPPPWVLKASDKLQQIKPDKSSSKSTEPRSNSKHIGTQMRDEEQSHSAVLSSKTVHHKYQNTWSSPSYRSPPASPVRKQVNKERILQALRVVQAHYSDDIEESHRVICPPSKTQRPSMISPRPESNSHSSHAMRLEKIARQRDRDEFLTNAIPNFGGILKEEGFASLTKNWLPRKSG